MAYYFPELPQTTYSHGYRYSPIHRFRSKYSEVPSIVDQPPIIQPPRQFPVEPYGPNRLNPLAQAPAAGLGSKGVSHRTIDAKELAQVMAAKNTKNDASDIPRPTILGLPIISGGYFKLPIESHLQDKATADKIYKDRVFKSTATRAMDECAIPMKKVIAPKTTIEERPDMIRVAPDKYEKSVFEWQYIPLWDKIQPRRHSYPPEPNPALERAKENREYRIQAAKEQDERVTSQIRSVVANDALASSFTLQHPGYMGFMPRWPTGQSMKRPSERAEMVTVSQATHRKFPSREYHPQRYGRHAPMSAQLTLTYPYNPFNKIEEDEEFLALRKMA